MSVNLQQLVNSLGWQEAEQIFIDELVNSKKLIDIKCDEKTNEQLGEIYRARKEAERLIQKILARIKREGNQTEKKVESYK
jgi:hypothetical protein